MKGSACLALFISLGAMHTGVYADTFSCKQAKGYDYYPDSEILRKNNTNFGWQEAAYSAGYKIALDMANPDRSVVYYQSSEGTTSTKEQGLSVTLLSKDEHAISLIVPSITFGAHQYDLYTLFEGKDGVTLTVQTTRHGSDLPKSGLVVAECVEIKEGK